MELTFGNNNSKQERIIQKYEFSIHVPIHTQLFAIDDFFLGQPYNQSFFVFCLRTHNFLKINFYDSWWLT